MSMPSEMACIDIQERTLKKQSDFLTARQMWEKTFAPGGESQIQHHRCYNLFSCFAFICLCTNPRVSISNIVDKQKYKYIEKRSA